MAPTDTRPDPAARKVALVTGGSRGLGRAVVLALAGQGVDTVLTYRANVAEADKVVAAAGEAGGRAVALQLDTGDTSTFAAFATTLGSALDGLDATGIDFLVNNAGTSHHDAIATTTEEAFDELYRVHLKGVFFLTQTLLTVLHDGGRIVNLSTGLTRMTYAGSASYAAMKGAVEVLTRYMADELGPRGIAVNTVAPGAIATDFSGGMVRDDPEVNARIAGVTALGRVGLPDDIGPMVASLLSEGNRWINAQRIEVSGGMAISR